MIQRLFHRALATLFQLRDRDCRRQEIHGHVPSAAEGRLKFFQREKNFAVIVTRIFLWLDIDRPYQPAILSGTEIRSRANMRVIKTKSRWTRRECNATASLRGNKRSSLFRR